MMKKGFISTLLLFPFFVFAARNPFDFPNKMQCLTQEEITSQFVSWQVKGIIADKRQPRALFFHEKNGWHAFDVNEFLPNTFWKVVEIDAFHVVITYFPSEYCPFYLQKQEIFL